MMSYEQEITDELPKMNFQFLRYSLPYEICVDAKGSNFYIIIGKYRDGLYMCIPNWSIGIEIVSLTDTFWNLEHLKNANPDLNEADAVSIVTALVGLSEYIEL